MRGRALLAVLALSAVVRAQTQGNQLPPPDPQKRTPVTLIHADNIHTPNPDEFLSVSGNVHIQYKGYDIYADRVESIRKTDVFRLEGNGRLVGENSEIFGEVVVVDFRNDTFTFEDGRARLSPEILEGQAKEDVFVSGASGTGTQGAFTIKKGVFTTCDKPVPHSKFVIESSLIKPGKYAALKNARLEVLGHTIFGIPYLVLPLVENGTRYLPDFGQSPDEGQYVKTRISTPLRGDDYFDTRVDYMTRLGPALGLDYHYDNSLIDGRFEFYTVLGENKSSMVKSAHKHEIGPGTFQFDATYQQQNYLTAPQSTLLNTRAQYVLPWTQGNTRLSWYRVTNDRTTFSSASQSYALSDTHSWTRKFSTQLDLNLSQTASTSTSSSTQSDRFDLRFTGRSDFDMFTADLLYQRSIPIGNTANFFSATDRTPMLVLRTDGARLLGPGTGRLWPFRTEFSVGELADPASGGSITRIDFTSALARTETTGNSSLRWSGGFKQGIYSDDTAQYVLDYSLGWQYRFTRRSSVDIGYRNHRAFGFTPLSMDRTGRNDALSFDFKWQALKDLLLTARTGYDVLQADRGNVPWQQLWFQTAYIPSKKFQLKTSSTYDTFSQVWSNMRLDASYVDGDFQVGIGTRFDGRRSTWATTSVFIQGLRIGRTTFGTALDYNGFTGRFDAQHYSLIYDLHEAEAVLDVIENNIGFRSGRQIALFIRLKAFPTRSPFGSGTRGQAVGGGTGFGN